jgi:hypothetical protein
MLNLVFAESLESKLHTGDECDWYWINVMLDVTLGVPIEYFLLVNLTAMIQGLLGPRKGQDFKSGSYTDSQGNVIYHKYIKQLFVWLLVVTGMKLCVLAVMLVLAGQLEATASYMLSPVSGHPDLKLIVVMILTPVTMNSIQYWLVDNIIKKKPQHEFEGDFKQQLLVDGFKQQLLMVGANTDKLDKLGALTILG